MSMSADIPERSAAAIGRVRSVNDTRELLSLIFRNVAQAGMASDRCIILTPESGHERERTELILLHDDRRMATGFLGGTRVLFIVMAPMARRFQMVLDVVVETEIAVLGVYEIDRMAMYLMRLIGINETMLIECDQCNKGPAKKARNKKVCGGHGIEDRDDKQNRIPDGESSDDFANLALLALFMR